MTRDDALFDEARLRQEVEEGGLLDPDQPTQWSHREYIQRMEAEFTPTDRRMIRYALGFAARIVFVDSNGDVVDARGMGS